MKKIRTIVTTTHIDAHNEALAREGIPTMIEHLNSQVIPMWIQHDPRIPPVGRFTNAEAETLPDGELAVFADGEIWEPGDHVPFLADRRMPLGKPDGEGLFVWFDRGLTDDATQTDLRQIEQVLGCDAAQEVKKALDPLTFLTLGGTFAVAAIANGFLRQVGADGYNLLKEKVKGIFGRRREAALSNDSSPETLFMFKAFVADEQGICLFDVIITNPSEDDIEWFFKIGLNKLDSMLPKLLADRHNIQRIVLEIRGPDLQVKYGVRSDAVPVPPILRGDDGA